MAIEFVCPACHSGLRVSDDAAGRVVRCGSCLTTVRVPASSGNAAPAPPPVPPAAGPDDDAGPLPSAAGTGSRPSAEPVAPPGAVRPRGRPIRRRPPPPPRTGRGVGFWILIALLIVGLLVAATCGGLVVLLQPKWHTHKSARGGFQVDLPAPARGDMREQIQLNNNNAADFHVEGTILPFQGEQFGVMWGEIDPQNRRQLTDKDLLDATVKGFRDDDPQTKILRDTEMTVSGFAAREVVLSHPTDGHMICRIVVADTRIYVVFVGSREAVEGNQNARRFLDSFQITDQGLLANAGNRKQRDEQRAARKAEDEREKERKQAQENLADAGEIVADLIDEEIETVREQAIHRGAGQSVGERVGQIAEQQRANAPWGPDRPDLPVAPPPRPKSQPDP